MTHAPDDGPLIRPYSPPREAFPARAATSVRPDGRVRVSWQDDDGHARVRTVPGRYGTAPAPIPDAEGAALRSLFPGATAFRELNPYTGASWRRWALE